MGLVETWGQILKHGGIELRPLKATFVFSIRLKLWTKEELLHLIYKNTLRNKVTTKLESFRFLLTGNKTRTADWKPLLYYY